MQASLKYYRLTREDTKRYLEQVKQAGFEAVCIKGDGDLAEIVYLTCLEAQVQVNPELDPAYPVFRIEGLRTALDWPNSNLSATQQEQQ
jgi:hypothetical protein